MSTAMTSYRRLKSEILWATAGYGQTSTRHVLHRMKRHRSAKIKRHRSHPRPPAPYATTTISVSIPRQAIEQANTTNINPHKPQKA